MFFKIPLASLYPSSVKGKLLSGIGNRQRENFEDTHFVNTLFILDPKPQPFDILASELGDFNILVVSFLSLLILTLYVR